MIAILALALACTVSAQTRPNIPENFFAEVQTELHQQDNVLFGDGRWAVDTFQNKGAEDYKFQDQRHGGYFYVFNLQRYDLGYVYELSSNQRNTCHEQAVSGNMPLTWGWVQNATYGGQKDFHGITLDTWVANFGGITLTLGVNTTDPNVPVIFNRDQTTSALYINFYRYNPSNDFDHNVFNVPQFCNQTARATPAVPNPSEDFEAFVNVDFRRSQGDIRGQGRMASDQTANKFVEEYDLQDNHDPRTVRFLNLLRFDLGEAYSINSRDLHDCSVHNLTGSMQPIWGWLSQATFLGQRNVGDHGLLDIWNYYANGLNLTLAVQDSDVNTPQFFARETTGTAEYYDFQYFNATTPNADDFTIPPECLH